ncbi:MAG: SpoIIIAH-like family protein [Oscillospiraceae bacterium]
MKMIFGKRQFALATLVFILGGAIYLNWNFAQSGNDFTSVDNNNNKENYGDSQLVNGEVKSENKDSKYFSETKLERDKKRDESVETIQTSLNNKNLSSDEKSKLTEDLSNIVNKKEVETKIESLIKAKGFNQCVVFVDQDKANVVVQSEGLTGEQAAQIKDIILRESKVKAENIRIVEVK